MSRSVVIASLVGALVGLGAGYLVFGQQPEPGPNGTAASEVPRPADASADEAPSLEGRPEDTPAPATTTPASPSPSETPPTQAGALPQHRVTEVATDLRARARQTIELAKARITNAERIAEAQVTRELEAARAAEDDRARGGTMKWLREMRKKHWEGVPLLVGSSEKFTALFARHNQGARVEGETFDSYEDLDDGDTILYPAGQFNLSVRDARRLKSFPKDLVIEGRGMDETLLVMDDEWTMNAEVHSLTFRDLTLHCGDNYLESMRQNPYTLKFERCRIIGFDMGAGGSAMLSGSTGAFYAVDSKIEAGFGRSPGSGNLFDVRGGLVARLENCDIVGPFSSIVGTRRNAIVFDNCRITKMPTHWIRRREQAAEHTRFINCQITDASESATRRDLQRSVTELNPAWKDHRSPKDD